MPYLDSERRKHLDGGGAPETGADLDYLFLRIVDQYHEAAGLRAENIITVCGSLVTSLLEYYRRIGAPYEQIKAAQNGDVFSAAIALLHTARPTLAPRPPKAMIDEGDLPPEERRGEAAGETQPPPARSWADEASDEERAQVAPAEETEFAGTPSVSGNPGIQIGENDGKRTDDGPQTDVRGGEADPNST